MRVVSDPKKTDVTRAYPAYTPSGYRIPGAQAIRIDPLTGQQVPIMLPAAEVYSDQDQVLAGLQDVVTGSTFGQLAKAYSTPQDKLTEAQLVAQLGQEFTGLPGAARAVNRLAGSNVFDSNSLFNVSPDDPTIDKVFDYLDLFGPLTGAGILTGGKQMLGAAQKGFKAVKNAPKEVLYSPAALRTLGKIAKKTASDNPSKATYGGLLSQPFVTSYSDEILKEAEKGFREYKRLVRERADLSEFWGRVAGRGEKVPQDISDHIKRLDEKIESMLNKDVKVANELSDKIDNIKDLSPEAKRLLERSVSNILKYDVNMGVGMTGNRMRDSALMSGINRLAQAGPNVPVMRGIQKDIATKIMERSGGVAKLEMDKVVPLLKEYGRKFGNVKPIAKDKAYKGLSTTNMSVTDVDKAPDLVKAFIYGDFKNFEKANSPMLNTEAREKFAKYYEDFGDLEVYDLPTTIKTTKDDPIKLTTNDYGGLVADESIIKQDPDIPSLDVDDRFVNKRDWYRPYDMRGTDIANNVDKTLTNRRFNPDKDDINGIHNVIRNEDGVPTSFTVNADSANDDPFGVTLDIAGHQQQWDVIDISGDEVKYVVNVIDIWKFDPGPYSRKWSGKSQRYDAAKQAAALHASGTPVVTGTTQYITLPKEWIIKRAKNTEDL